MAWLYEPGAIRWKRHTAGYDVRAHRAPKGWVAEAGVLEYHPITGRRLNRSQWWIRETFIGEET